MQKYIKNDLTEVRYFNDDDVVEDWIDIEMYRVMTDEEIYNHENPIDTRTDEEKRASLPSLTRYQFFRALLENGIKTTTVVEKINAIEDEYTRELALLGWNDATSFVRTDGSVKLVRGLLELTDEQVDEMWVEALKY